MFLLQVILWGRTEKCLKETAEEISLSGTECHYFLCDVANREEVYKQAKVVREKVRPLNTHWDNFYPDKEKCLLHTVRHIIKYFLRDASVSSLCKLALNCSVSHLVYRLHFIRNIWIRVGNIADSSGAPRLYHLVKADRKCIQCVTPPDSSPVFIVVLFNLRWEMLRY